MDKLMDAAQVKKQYRLAMMLCHPDKVRGTEDPDKIYIANRCFAALTEGFNDFKVSVMLGSNPIIERRGYPVSCV